MSVRSQQRASVAPASPASASRGGLLQRKCGACGDKAAGLKGECEDCDKKKLVGLQRKLTVGAADDPFEREADRVAERVLSAPAPGPHEQAPPAVRRQAVTPVGPASGGTAFDAPAAVHEALDSPGRPLDAQTRSFMESRFGHDFGRVRVHTDDRAAESASAVGASAYTVGSDVVFARGSYAPSTTEGRRLLAHELTHVLQQSGGPGRAPAQRLMRQACAHDKLKTGCGRGTPGVADFADASSDHYDQLTVKKGLEQDLGGKWLTEIQSPKNPEKKAKDTGRIDGVKVLETEGSLGVEIVEVKPRFPGRTMTGDITGGCHQATKEATGYVTELKRLAPRIKTLSEKFAPFGGFRLLGKHKPTLKAEKDIFEKAGINIEDKDWLDAWRFYNSLQQNIPKVFKKRFASVNIGLYTGGTKDKKYRAFGWLIKCKDNKQGKEELFYMVNNAGGVSYGCEKDCQPKEEPDPKEQVKPQVVHVPKDEPAAPPVAVVTPQIEVFNLFRPTWVWRTLPQLPPGQLVVFGVGEKLFDGYVGRIQVNDTLQLLKIRLSAPLFTRLEGAVILFTAAVTGVVAASVAIWAAPAAAAAPAALPLAAPTTAPAALPLVTRFLATAAANDNAIAFAKAAGILLAVGAASASKDANAEESATKLVKGVIEDNTAILAVANATGHPQLDKPGAKFVAANGKVYKVFAVARS